MVESHPYPPGIWLLSAWKPHATSGALLNPRAQLPEARESLLSTGGNWGSPENIQTPMGVPAARFPSGMSRAAPHPRPCQTVGQTARPAIHTRDGSRQPHRAGLRACVLLSLPSLGWVVLLWVANSFRSQPPPSPSPASILRKQTGMCLGFTVKSDRSLPTCSGRLRYGAN